MSAPHEIRATLFARINDENPEPVPITFGEIATRIRGDHYRERTEAVRAATTDDQARTRKKDLPVFVPALATARGEEGLSQAPEYVQADVDNYDPHASFALLEQFKADPHVALAFKSPRGGAKAFFRINPNRPFHESWDAVAKYVKGTYDVEIDTDAKGRDRVCYLTHDPDCYLAPGPVAVVPYPAASTSATTAAPEAPALLSTGTKITHTTAMRRELMQAIPRAKQGHYSDWLNPIGALQATGASHDECIELLNEWDPEKSPGLYLEKLSSGLDQFDALALANIARKHGWRPSAAYVAEIRNAEHIALSQELDARQFGKGEPPPKPTPRFLMDGVPICTPGNLTTVQSQVKTGKTAVVGAFIASTIVAENGEGTGHDTLGFSASQPEGRTLLHFDCEQSAHHHYQSMTQALRRAGVDVCPSYIKSYGLAGYTAAKLLAALRLRAQQEVEGPGLFAIVLDGFGDFLNDVNEAREANPLVAELQDMAIRFDCCVVGILHENPGKQNQGEKSRGHLGSQLQRKSETNLVLKRDGDVTTIYAEKTRGAAILEKYGHRFTWSETDGMHMTVEAPASGAPGISFKQGKKLKAQRELAAKCFAGAESLTTAELKTRITTETGVTLKRAEGKITEMVAVNILLRQAEGYYTLAEAA